LYVTMVLTQQSVPSLLVFPGTCGSSLVIQNFSGLIIFNIDIN
jgi:hypothetical protein